MDDGKGTNSTICGELHFQRATVLSNDNRLYPVRSALCRLASENRLTRYGELLIARAPVITKGSMRVDDFARLSILCPNRTAAFHSDLNPDLGCRGNISIYAHALMSGRIGKIRDILALRWCPGLVVFPLHFALHIFYKQP